jgi:cellulase/cellobiase CelA1
MKRHKPVLSLLGLGLIAGFMAGGSGVTSASAMTTPLDSVDLCADWAQVEVGPYIYQNNVWGKDKAQSGYDQCLQERTVDGKQQIGWKWDWPGSDKSVFAYPEIIFGYKPWSGGASTDSRLPLALSDMGTVTMNYDVEMEATGGYNLAPEVWLTSTDKTGEINPGDITTEIMFWMDKSGASKPYGDNMGSVEVDGQTYDVYSGIIGDSTGGASGTWRIITYDSRNTQYKASLKLDEFIRDSISRKLATESDYLATIEFGNEVTGGTGSTWVKDYSVELGGSDGGTDEGTDDGTDSGTDEGTDDGSTPPPATDAGCTAVFSNQNEWGNGSTSAVTVTNTGGSAIDGWTLTFNLPDGQKLIDTWGGAATQDGTAVTVEGADYNATIDPGASRMVGFNLTHTGNNSAPTDFMLNGEACE